ncbi:hypothetical protein C8R43DRAFT_820320, partial [Mycena crocata]
VLLGNTLPRPDRSPMERDKWCRAMLILFKPWRQLADLKAPGQSWTDAYEATVFTPYTSSIMTNLNVENECKDARDKYEELRKAGKVRPLLPGHDGAIASTDIESLTTALHSDTALDV